MAVRQAEDTDDREFDNTDDPANDGGEEPDYRQSRRRQREERRNSERGGSYDAPPPGWFDNFAGQLINAVGGKASQAEKKEARNHIVELAQNLRAEGADDSEIRKAMLAAYGATQESTKLIEEKMGELDAKWQQTTTQREINSMVKGQLKSIYKDHPKLKKYDDSIQRAIAKEYLKDGYRAAQLQLGNIDEDALDDIVEDKVDEFLEDFDGNSRDDDKLAKRRISGVKPNAGAPMRVDPNKPTEVNSIKQVDLDSLNPDALKAYRDFKTSNMIRKPRSVVRLQEELKCSFEEAASIHAFRHAHRIPKYERVKGAQEKRGRSYVP